VTSSGKYLITWNFEKVKRGHLKGGYKLKNLHEHAVDGQFQYNHEEKVLVTLP
jgi:VID27 C-terminal WD40-like domain